MDCFEQKDCHFFPKIWLPSLLLPISKPKTFLEIGCLQLAGYLMLETWNPQIISRIFDIFSWVSCSLGLGQRVLFYHNSCPWFTEDWECSTMSHYYLFNFKEKTGIDKNDFCLNISEVGKNIGKNYNLQALQTKLSVLKSNCLYI